MSEYLTYENINWNKYLFIFNKFINIQCIFIIPEDDINNCLKIGTMNMLNIYDLTPNKILKLNTIGPFITKKDCTKNYNGNNLEESVIDFFIENKYYKWIGILDKDLKCNFVSNYFNLYNQINIKNYCFIIPNRNREETLKTTKNKIYEYIKKNNILADIWIINQNNNINWNKGTTLNIGFKILESFYDYFVFNDGDIYLTKNIKPFLSPNNLELLHLYGYDHCIGGIFIINKNDFKLINGFSNNYFNWGREDTDLQDRILNNNIKINRKFINYAEEIKHQNDNNLWNLKKNTLEYNKAKKLFYFNMIEYYKKDYNNGLSNLFEGNECNTKLIYFIKVNYYQTSLIKITTNKNEILIKFNINEIFDEIIVTFKNIIKKIPINENKEIKIIFNKINKKYYFQLEIDTYNNLSFEIEEYNPNKTEVIFNNIKKEYMITYTPFNYEKIFYSYYPKVNNESYYLLVNF